MATGTPSRMPGRPPSIGDLIRSDGPTFSFEFFPPKTPNGERLLWQAIRELEALQPSFVSVTYGAGGSSREKTVEVTERIATETTLLPLAHFTAVNHSVAELRNLIGNYAAVGVRNIMALRGDPPGDPQGEWTAHSDGVEYAYQLVELIKQSGDFCVGVAAFPEVHPRSPDFDTDVRHFIAKVRAGADYAVTQFFFNWEDWARYRDAVAGEGCGVPIVPGVMPVTNVKQIQRMAQLSGAEFPPDLAQRLLAVAEDPEAVRAIGVEVATDLSSKLLAEGAPGIHFITLNRSTATREVWQNLRVGTTAAQVG
ncbi:MAG: methylenetetrahydrofolate reductase [NAD(P)H] [Micromonosporaceae bacterium]